MLKLNLLTDSLERQFYDLKVISHVDVGPKPALGGRGGCEAQVIARHQAVGEHRSQLHSSQRADSTRVETQAQGQLFIDEYTIWDNS